MPTIVDMDQAFLKVKVETQQWEQEFLQAFNLPLIQAQATQQFLALPPAERARLKQADPKLHAELTANVQLLLAKVKAARAAQPAADSSGRMEEQPATDEPGAELQEQEQE